MLEEIISNPFIQLLCIILSLPLSKQIKRCIKWITLQKEKNEQKKRMKYYSLLNSIEFQNWRDEALKKIYGEHYFTNVFNVNFPAFVIEFEKYFSYNEF